MSIVEDVSVAAMHEGDDAGVFTWDLSADMVYADATLAKLFGLNAREAECGLPIIRFLEKIDSVDKPKIAKAIHESIITGETYQQDYGILQTDGTVTNVAAFGRCFRGADGTPSHYAGIVCLRINRPSSQEALFWHCLQAHDLARQSGQWEMVRLLEEALRKCGEHAADTARLH